MTRHIASLRPSFALAVFTTAVAYADPVTITKQPLNLTVLDGAPCSLSVTATGSDPIYYQWFLNGAKIDGATNNRYDVSAVAMKNDGAKYHVVVSNMSDDKLVTATTADVTLHVTTV